MFKSRQKEGSVMGGVFIAFFILIFHVALLALIGVLVLFLSGLLNYLPWLLLGGLVILLGAGYLLVRRLAKKSESLVRFLNLPELQGKDIEVKVMGGLASVKINSPEDTAHMLPDSEYISRAPRQLENPDTGNVRELMRLADMLEEDLITREEYMQAKQRLLGGS
ncbi:MAG: hypothetical protein ACLFQ9_09590 [Desulfobacterales bacterium]